MAAILTAIQPVMLYYQTLYAGNARLKEALMCLDSGKVPVFFLFGEMFWII